MADALSIIGAENLALVQHLGGQAGFPLPYGQEILLLRCQVAGTSYRGLADHSTLLNVGDRLILRREAANSHDSMAIQVRSGAGTMLGYVPRDRNEIIARLMDAGKHLIANLIGKELVGNWLKLDISILLHDC